MSEMLTVGASRWLYRSDLERPIIGREDPADLAEDCWGYLEDWHTHAEQLLPATHERAQRATAELIAARVGAAAAAHGAEKELKALIARQQATINRLLAFVPTRSGAVTPKRLNEIISHAEASAARLFMGYDVAVSEADEPDEDASASHRLTVDVRVRGDIDFKWFAAQSLELQRDIAAYASAEELRAIRVIVEPEAI